MYPIEVCRFRGLLDTQAMITGSTGVNPNRVRGFSIPSGIGSLTDGTCNFKGGAAYNILFWAENGGGGADFIQLQLVGLLTNDGWTRMSVDGGTTDNVDSFLRSAATFAAGANTSWIWSGLGLGVGGPFGAGGSNHTIRFY